MAKQSAGILLYRIKNQQPEFFLVHPGGPFWLKKDAGAWSIPKGEIEEGEDAMNVAVREFKEETGQEIIGKFIPLELVKQKAGKLILAWAVEGDVDETKILSNTFEIEWPPKSGKMKTFPEIDKAEWFSTEVAKEKINPAQANFINELLGKLDEKK
jgi:predicted NUDIX family NTP pyrophosphohydrolase